MATAEALVHDVIVASVDGARALPLLLGLGELAELLVRSGCQPVGADRVTRLPLAGPPGRTRRPVEDERQVQLGACVLGLVIHGSSPCS